MELNLKGKKALVTGGSKGIGLAIKEALEKEGVKVYSFSRIEGTDLQIDKNRKKVGKLMQDEDIDFLINNVGGGGTWLSPSYNDVMEMNYNITFELIDYFLGKPTKKGRVITISSIYGKEKGPNPWFTAAKSAQIALMKSLASYRRYEFKNITFNTICPGCINTKKDIKQFAKKNKLTLGEPEDVANIVTFLCSDLAKHINGAVITVDGGDSHSF